MKKKSIHISFFILLFQFTSAQNFVKIGDTIVIAENFEVDLEFIMKKYDPDFVNLNVFEKVERNDSIIKNVELTVIKDVEKPTLKYYYSLLNKPFPYFELSDLNKIKYSNTSFFGKPTIICIWSPENLPTRNEIKKLNRIFLENQFNVIAFVTDKIWNKPVVSKVDFPIFENTSYWLKSNLVDYYFKQYLIINSKGIVSYLFPNYPNRYTIFKPIDKINLAIFERLLN